MNDPSELSEHTIVETWLRLLGQDAHLDLKFDARGVCTFSHVCGIDLAIEAPLGHGAVYLRAPLLPLNGREDMLRHCMLRHMLGLETGCATFALDDSERIVLWRRNELATLAASSFTILVIEFIASAARLKTELEQLVPAQSTQPAQPVESKPFADPRFQMFNMRA